MRLHIHTRYYKYHRTLVIKPLDGKDEVKIHGDPMKALVLAIIFQCEVEKAVRGGFIINATEEVWKILKIIERQRISWKKLVENEMLSNPSIEKIKKFLYIQPLIR